MDIVRSTIDRRQLVLGGFALLLGACGRGAAAGGREADVALLPAPVVGSLGTPRYVEDARAWIVAVPDEVRERAVALLPADVHAGVREGMLALSEVCPSDKLKLVHCESSSWFECPGCGSKFSGLGDKVGGPAPAGMSLRPLHVDAAGEVVISPTKPVDGLRSGTSLVRQKATGPHCA